jgi:glycosyltransferase involved in cell wall biosynthesis
MNIDISIIIPVYNMEKYLKQCLDSVFCQIDENIEVIIVNDGSTDDSRKVIEKYLNLYKNVVYIEQENQGVSISRNKGIERAKGEYIMFLDSDDYLEKKSVSNLYIKAKEKDMDILIFGHRKVYDENNNFDKINTIFDENKVYEGNQVAQRMLSGDIEGYCCDKLLKHEYIKKNKLEFQQDVYIEDFFPIFQQIYKSKRIGFYNDVVYNYRQRVDSISNSKNKKLLTDFTLCVDNIQNYIYENEININKQYIDAYKAQGFNFMITIFFEINDKAENIYEKFYNLGYKKYEVKIGDILSNKYINRKTKIAILLWKMRLYHILIPGLRSMQKNIRFKIGIDL